MKKTTRISDRRNVIIEEYANYERKPAPWIVDVVVGLSQGKKVEQIAGEIFMSNRTLEAKLNTLRGEYSCINLTHLVATFLRNKIID